jgi:hypothetical protein
MEGWKQWMECMSMIIKWQYEIHIDLYRTRDLFFLDNTPYLAALGSLFNQPTGI